MMNDYIVEMKHITKRFPGILANDDISIEVKRGEIFALLGENGAGKSTLMSMLYGMYEPDAGEIFIRGEKVRLSSSSVAANLNIGMVHQHFTLVSNYTISENIVLGIEPTKKILGILPWVDMKSVNARVLDLSKRYGLEVDPEKKIEDVNVSVQQRVEILKMLYREAEILIFDEPTAILTPQEIESLLDIMRELRAAGKTIILITHKLEEIKKIADRCAVLLRGRLVNILDVADTSTQTMASLMVGRDVVTNLEKKPAAFGDVVLDVRDLSVRNSVRFEVVKGVSFTIRAGEILAIAGVSGNGQVEVADAIAGLTKVSHGSIFLSGKDITHYSIRKRTLAGISYIPEDRQSYGVVLDFTLRDNLALKTYFAEPFSHKGILNASGFDAHAERLIAKYDIRSGQGAKTSLRSMSGGNQQKAIIGREIELESELSIFVQPTRGLDIGAIENIHRQILAERDAGKAVLLISLELDEVMALADTIAVMYNGEILKIAETATMSQMEVGKYMMGVRS
jgi:general nucleoside transport system ATP-binding protein